MSEQPAKDITEHAELPWFSAIPKSKLFKFRKGGKKWLKRDSTDDEAMKDYMEVSSPFGSVADHNFCGGSIEYEIRRVGRRLDGQVQRCRR